MTNKKASRIAEIHAYLKSLDSLSPIADHAHLFDELKSITQNSSADEAMEILSLPEISTIILDLNRFYAEQGYLVEKHRVETFIANNSVELSSYESYDLIRKRVKYEVSAIEMVSDLGIDSKDLRCLFIGSGPLPLTAILLAREYGISTTCIDRNEEAVGLSRKVITLLGLENKIEVRLADAESSGPCPEYTIIFLAGMVGRDTTEKMAILRYLSNKSQPGTVFMLRSAENLRTILYSKIDEAQLGDIDLRIKLIPYGNWRTQMDKIRSLIVGIGWFVHNRPNDLTGSLMQEIERLPLSEEFIRSFSSMTEKDVIQDSEKRRIFLEEAESVKDYLLIQHPKVAAEINTTWRRVVSVH